MAKEIYRIKFNKKVIHENDSEGEHTYHVCEMYTLGATGLVDGEMLTPKKITVKDDKIKVQFSELGIIHEFTRKDDTELFYRDKIKKNADKTNNNAH